MTKPTDPSQGRDAREPDPVIKLDTVCPSCGRKAAFVFPLLRPGTGRPSGNPPIVCLACCPKPPPPSPDQPASKK
ncbi:MAG TPA: hypothetical protein VKE40_19130 [Gemmataceae bacterium]|nr:hypothetical protein [Gemmataceae bacterium]